MGVTWPRGHARSGGSRVSWTETMASMAMRRDDLGATRGRAEPYDVDRWARRCTYGKGELVLDGPAQEKPKLSSVTNYRGNQQTPHVSEIESPPLVLSMHRTLNKVAFFLMQICAPIQRSFANC